MMFSCKHCEAKTPINTWNLRKYFFFGKNFVLVFFGEKDPDCAQNEAFQVLWKIKHGTENGPKWAFQVS